MSITQNWIDRADRSVMKTYGRYPLVAMRGEGCRLWDVDDKEYLDFLAGVAVNNLGHCHPKVVAALRDPFDRDGDVGDLAPEVERRRRPVIEAHVVALGAIVCAATCA